MDTNEIREMIEDLEMINSEEYKKGEYSTMNEPLIKWKPKEKKR